MGGQFSDFLYWDPNDNAVTNDFVAVGDGTTTTFQLIHSIGIGEDIVQNPGSVPAPPILFVNGISTPYTLGPNGLVTFASAPAIGNLITWTGSYYYRVRFADDGLDFDQFLDKVWSLKTLRLQSVIL
jgi:hypothetical protein